MTDSVMLQRQWFITSKRTDISQEYSLGLEIGSGNFGKVFMAQQRETGLFRAVKLIHKQRVQDYNTFITELAILSSLDHPNIVNIIETFETEAVCYVILEYCAGGELFEKLSKVRRFTEQAAAKIMRSLLSAVMYCHNHGICHRDLKPENCVFIDADEMSDIKIIDFGLSKSVTEEEILNDIVGTPYYIAPEMLTGSYTKEVDCWSLGVILYMLLGGTPPFNGVDNQDILMNVYSGKFTFKHKAFRTVSDQAKDLIVRLLTKNPSYRLTAQQAFMHPWIQDLNPVASVFIPDSVLMSFTSFSRANPLKQATLSYIASKIGGIELEKLRNLFKSIDINGDGVLSKREFGEVVLSQSYLSVVDVEIICRYLDTNKNGEIDYNEFIAGCLIRPSFRTEEWTIQAFHYFDRDGSGFITEQELREALHGGDLAVDLGRDDIREIIQQADFDHDGRINFEEFRNILMTPSHN
jgi:calcium-dependent protein kinase